VGLEPAPMVASRRLDETGGAVHPMRRDVAPTIAVLGAGTKGLRFIADLADRLHDAAIARVVTYAHAADGEPTVADFAAVTAEVGATLVESRRATPDDLAGVDLVFVVGWQFLFDDLGVDTVVFHDSLLPRHRGFAPTVAALIAGDDHIGVTALRPEEQADAGPVLAQVAVPVTHPLRIADAFELLRPCYVDAALEVLDGWSAGPLVGTPQDEASATFSIWRDDHDFEIDWTWPADRIVRFVHAVGPPYGGARSRVGDDPVIITTSHEIDDLAFSERHPGKVWRLGTGAEGTGVDVVCGAGMVRVGSLTTPDGAPYAITRLRTRLGATHR
jgi:methionyl-tRNA formyltransferase